MTKRIHEFNFKKDGAHVALVDKAANQQTVLMMKAEEPEVSVSLSMRSFLSKFFGLWGSDAEVLAGVLGYNTSSTDPSENNTESWDDYIKGQIDSVSLLKGIDIPENLNSGLVEKIEVLMGEYGDKLNTSKDSPSEVNTPNGESTLDKTEIEALQKAAEESKALKAQIEQMQKSQESSDSLIAELQKAATDKKKEEMTTVVEGYSFIKSENQEAVVDALLAMENAPVILAELEKARDAIAAATMAEQGNEAPSDDPVEETQLEKTANAVGDIIKQRNTKG
jgi:hypothetical protein